jgi:hypothetical protein
MTKKFLLCLWLAPCVCLCACKKCDSGQVDEIRFFQRLELTSEKNHVRLKEYDSIVKMGQHCEGRYKIIKPEYIVHDDYVLTCNRGMKNKKDTVGNGSNILFNETFVTAYENPRYTFWLEPRYSYFVIKLDETSDKGTYIFTFTAISNSGKKHQATTTLTHP